MKGWLIKEGGSWKSWKKRYFVLEKYLLSYFTDESMKILKGTINLSFVTNINIVDDYHKKFIKIIRICTPSRNFHLCASNESERNIWYNSILNNFEQSNIYKPRLSKPSVSQKDFEIKCMLGKGSYGKVFLVEMISSHEIFAMKTVKKKQLIDCEQIEHTMSERRILSKLHHPFLVNLHYSFQSPSYLFYIIDYCPGGELYFFLQNNKINEDHVKFYAAQILLAIDHLHSNKIIYRDIKPENILIGEDGYLRLTDFGLSKENIGKDCSTGTFCGTPEYISPEVLSGHNYSISIDWWGFGVLIYEMIHGSSPFSSKDVQELFDKILHHNVVFPNETYPSENCKDLIIKLLEKEPEKRLSDPNHIKSHPWFQGFDWENLIQKKIEPPYTPLLKNKTDTSNFSSALTNEKIMLEETDTVSENKEFFEGFTYY